MCRVLTHTRWLHAADLEPAETQQWKDLGLVFTVLRDGLELFADYQFIHAEGKRQPKPCMHSVLEAFGPVDETCALAAWFHYPGRWIVQRDAHGARHLSPAEALRRGMDDIVVKAARMRLDPGRCDRTESSLHRGQGDNSPTGSREEGALEVRLLKGQVSVVTIDRMRLSSNEWLEDVDNLVAGVLELIATSGELDRRTSTPWLMDLRQLAERVRDCA